MDWARPYLKVAALASSLLLVAAFVGCQSGAIRPFSKPAPPNPAAQPEVPPTASRSEPVFFPSTKSSNFKGIVVGFDLPDEQPTAPPEPQPAPEGKPVFMGGTKSLNRPFTGIPQPEPPQPTPERKPVYLGGTKAPLGSLIPPIPPGQPLFPPANPAPPKPGE